MKNGSHWLCCVWRHDDPSTIQRSVHDLEVLWNDHVGTWKLCKRGEWAMIWNWVVLRAKEERIGPQFFTQTRQPCMRVNEEPPSIIIALSSRSGVVSNNSELRDRRSEKHSDIVGVMSGFHHHRSAMDILWEWGVPRNDAFKGERSCVEPTKTGKMVLNNWYY